MQTSFSKQKFLLILFVANSFLLLGQSKQDTITISNYVVKQGEIYSFFEPYLGYVNPVHYINISTNEDSVFSVSDGVVKSFFKMDESDFVMIESKDAWFTYGHINISSLKKSDKVSNGQFLGVVSKTNNNEKDIIFSICYKGKDAIKCLNYIDLYDYLKKYKK